MWPCSTRWCGLAVTVRELIFARAIQGVAAALLVPGSLSIIGASFNERERGKAIGTWTIGFSLDRVQAETGRTRATIALVGLIAFAVAVVAVFFLSALITEPLRRMVDATQRIAARQVGSPRDRSDGLAKRRMAA